MMRVFIPGRNVSRYSLTGTMCAEISDVLRETGATVNPPEPMGPAPALFLWVNFLTDDADLWQKPIGMSPCVQFVRFFVDHPLALVTDHVDRLVTRSQFKLVLPCLDGVHLLRPIGRR